MARRLLLVDDDEAARLTLGALLEDEGYTVVEAGSLAQARAALALAPEPFSVALLDLKLGDGLGTDLAPLLRAHSPSARIVLLSGCDPGVLPPGCCDARLTKGAPFQQLLALLA